MKKTKLTRSLMAACSIVALSAVMYGCVHDGGDPAPVAEMPEMPEMPAPPPVALELPDGNEIAVELGESDMLTIPAGMSETRGGVVFSCAAGGEACTVTVTNNLGDLVAQSTGGMVTAELTEERAAEWALILEDRANAAEDAEAAREARRQQDSSDRAESLSNRVGSQRIAQWGGTQTGSLNDFATVEANRPAYIKVDLGADDAVGGVDDNADTSKNDVIIGRITVDEMGGRMIDVDGDSSTDNDPEFAAVDAPPALRDGWSGGTLERTHSGGRTDHVVIYSDVMEAASETFAEAYGALDGNAPPTPTSAAELKIVKTSDFSGEVKPGTATYESENTDAEQRVEATDAASTAQFWMLAKTTASLAQSYAAKTTSTPGGQFRGTFDGVMGTFECTHTAACTGPERLGEDGLKTPTGGADQEWTFTADDSGATVDSARPDGDYLVMGFWVEMPQTPSSRHEFAAFFAGSDPFSGAAFNPLVGKAKYTGPAVGKYVNYVIADENSYYQKGVFRADATLNADFGADDEAGMVEGTVTNFMGEDDISLGDWSVVLKEADITADAATGATVNGRPSSDTQGTAPASGISGALDGRQIEGGWDAQFFGDGGSVLDHPSSIAGYFNASTIRVGSDTHPYHPYVALSGVFGAHQSSE